MNRGNVLITGAAGFIGSAVARNFLEMGFSVTTIDNLSTGFEENIPQGVHFIKGSAGDPSIISRLRENHFEGIVHIAGQSSGEVSFEDPVYDLESNTQSTVLLLQYALRNKIKKFVFASTMSVYGDHTELPVKENSLTTPKSFYACGKLASENYMRIYSNMGIQCSALRLFNVYGRGQNMTNLRQGMLSIFLAHAIQNGHIVVKGSLERFRDFVHITDVCRAFELVYHNDPTDFQVFNICSGSPTKVRDLIEIIASNLPEKITQQEAEGTPGDQFGIFGSNDKILDVVGWSAEQNIRDGIVDMINWAKNE